MQQDTEVVGVTDYAATVRAALSWCEEGEMGESHRKKGLAALDALVAERDEARRKYEILSTDSRLLGGETHLTALRRAEAAEAERDKALTAMSAAWDDTDRITAEVPRLREALAQIANRGCHNAPRCEKLPADSWHCAACIARAALAAKETGE